MNLPLNKFKNKFLIANAQGKFKKDAFKGILFKILYILFNVKFINGLLTHLTIESYLLQYLRPH